MKNSRDFAVQADIPSRMLKRSKSASLRSFPGLRGEELLRFLELSLYTEEHLR
jgi:hypothetical protein